MKKLAIIFLVTGLLGSLSSCNDWLDVKPYDSMTEEQLYSTESGIQRALNGLYLDLASNSLYAKNLTCGAMEVLGQRYYIGDEHTYYDLSKYKYSADGPKSTFEGIWKSGYKLIAGCNEFLEKVPEHEEVLARKDYLVMMGEAMALRTFLHFDLFRLFGAVYSAEGKTKSAIPYYDRVTDLPAPILTGEELMKHLISDMDTALLWLSGDPVRTDGVVKGDEFWDYRNFRMNYYAAWALKARMYYYMGKEYDAQAHQIVMALLSDKDPLTGETNQFMKTFKSVTEDNELSNNTQDRVYFSELLFGLHNMKRNTLYKDMFSTDLENNNILMASNGFLKKIFAEDGDLRNAYWEILSGDRENFRACLKYHPYEAMTSDPYRYEIQSLIRKSELYLLAAATTEDEEVKRENLENLRLTRGYSQNNTLGKDLDELWDKECQREFYGEGQYFFFLKRNGVTTIDRQSSDEKVELEETIDYVIPLPESETNNRYE